jgi:hypothetical protein
MRRSGQRATSPRFPSSPFARAAVTCLVVAGIAGGLGWAAESDVAAPRVAIGLRDGETVTGRIVVEAQDGGVLLRAWVPFTKLRPPAPEDFGSVASSDGAIDGSCPLELQYRGGWYQLRDDA